MKILVATTLVFATACKEPVGAHIKCEVVDDLSAVCTITQTKGTAEVEVCWDFKVTCHNEATLEAPRNCAKVKGGGSTTATTPKDKMVFTRPRGACDVVRSSIVSNATLDGDPISSPAK